MYGGPNLVTAKKPQGTKINSWFSLFERNVSILSFLTLFVAENVSMPLSETIKVVGRLVSLSVTLPFEHQTLGKLDHRNQGWTLQADWDMRHNTIHNTRTLSLVPEFHDKMSLKPRA